MSQMGHLGVSQVYCILGSLLSDLYESRGVATVRALFVRHTDTLNLHTHVRSFDRQIAGNRPHALAY